jgi:hypothetical protein
MVKVKRNMKKFIQDILRDKNSTKYSITKSIAVLITIVLVAYIGFATYMKLAYDQFLIGQLIVMILTLTGFKNNFGISKLQSKKEEESEVVLDMKTEADIKDEAEF